MRSVPRNAERTRLLTVPPPGTASRRLALEPQTPRQRIRRHALVSPPDRERGMPDSSGLRRVPASHGSREQERAGAEGRQRVVSSRIGASDRRCRGPRQWRQPSRRLQPRGRTVRRHRRPRGDHGAAHLNGVVLTRILRRPERRRSHRRGSQSSDRPLLRDVNRPFRCRSGGGHTVSPSTGAASSAQANPRDPRAALNAAASPLSSS